MSASMGKETDQGKNKQAAIAKSVEIFTKKPETEAEEDQVFHTSAIDVADRVWGQLKGSSNL